MSFGFLRYGVPIIAVLGITIWVMHFLSNPIRQQIIKNYWQQTTQTNTEPFTELYFEHSDELPLSPLVASNQTYNFIIRSFESKPTIYTYMINQITKGEQKMIGSGQVELMPSQQRLVPITLPEIKNVRTEIVVVLTGETTQHISFWLEAL